MTESYNLVFVLTYIGSVIAPMVSFLAQETGRYTDLRRICKDASRKRELALKSCSGISGSQILELSSGICFSCIEIDFWLNWMQRTVIAGFAISLMFFIMLLNSKNVSDATILMFFSILTGYIPLISVTKTTFELSGELGQAVAEIKELCDICSKQC